MTPQAESKGWVPLTQDSERFHALNLLVDVDPRPLEGIPPTDWKMNTKEASDWSWTAPAGQKDEDSLESEDVKQVAMWTMKVCRDEGMSPYETEKFVLYSRTTVANWLEDYDDGGEKRDWVASVERAIA